MAAGGCQRWQPYAGEDNDETGYNKDQTSIGVLEDRQQNNEWDKGCMIDMFKEEVAINKCNRGATAQ